MVAQHTETTIASHDIELVNVDDLQFDENNPNTLSDRQMHALSTSFQKFGYLAPIIIDQNNLIADGEHRAAVYKKFNMPTIPAYRVNFNSDVERRLLRQTMNKLRGFHDPYKDSAELNIINDAGLITDLTELIAADKATIQYIMEQTGKEGEENWEQALRRQTNESNLEKIHGIHLDLNDDDFQIVTETLQEFNINKNVAIIMLIREWQRLKQQSEMR